MACVPLPRLQNIGTGVLCLPGFCCRRLYLYVPSNAASDISLKSHLGRSGSWERERERGQEEARSVSALSAALRDSAQVTAAEETDLPILGLSETLWSLSAEVEDEVQEMSSRVSGFVIYV